MKRNKYNNEKAYINDKINVAVNVECCLIWLLWSGLAVVMVLAIYEALNKFGII